MKTLLFVLSALLLVAYAGAAPDHDAYLKANELFRTKDYPAAESAAKEFLKAHPESEWGFKARFLLANALIEQAKHKEAEAIYAAEAERVFSKERKQALAAQLIAFADKLSKEPDASDLDALPADHAKALDLYKQVLTMEIPRELRDDILFKVGGAHAKLDQRPDAVNVFRQYLAEFDPTWAGAVGTDSRKRGQLKENPKPAGKHRIEARAALIDAQFAAADYTATKQNANDLLELLAKEKPDDDTTAARARQRLINAHDMDGVEEQQVATRRAFVKHHPKHPLAPKVSQSIAEIYTKYGRADEAVAAHEDFIAGKNYQFDPAAEGNTTPDGESGISPAEQVEQWKQNAAFQIGQIRFNQSKYDDAIAAWSRYVARYPSGSQWAASQSGIVNAEFQKALGAVAADDEKLARELFDSFLKKYPLDGRAAQVLFTLGQMHMAAAEKMETEDKNGTKRFKQAIEEWSRLISKYPGTEQSSLALYRTGVIYSEKLDQLEEGLAAFRKLNWGSWAAPAKGRVTLLSEKSLGVATERTFRTDEQPEIAVTTLNIESVKVSLYPLNLESYFRKTHALGRVDHLDIDLIQPDKTWEVKFDGFKKYREVLRHIPIPAEGKGAFAGIVKVEAGDWSATTLVLRSDVELILKSSKRELLVYAEDARQSKPAAGAKLLISDGSKIISTGVTGEDGVYRSRLEDLQSLDSVRVFANTPGGVATNMLAIGGLQFSTGLTPRGYIYTDKPAYRPGEHVAVRGILREVKDGSYAVPAKADWEVTITDPSGRMVSSNKVTLDRFGAFDTGMKLPRGAQLGDYAIAATEPDSGTRWNGKFTVKEFKLDRIKLALDFPQRVYFRGETVKGTIAATYYWGSPAADQLVSYSLPDGRTREGKTDAAGQLEFELDTTGFTPGQALTFSATVKTYNITQSASVFLAQLGFNMQVQPSQPLALAGEPFEVEVKTVGADGEPVGKEITLTVLRGEAAKSNRTLEAVPWLAHSPPPPATVTVEEHQLTTDPKTGKGTLTLKLDKGGVYLLRAGGQDRFDQSVSSQSYITISDDEDANKLRFFAKKSTYEVGAKVPLRLHSRVDAKLALLTFEGEEILSHKVIALKKGYNDIDTTVEHAHFPNFRVSIALIDGGTLRAATKRFNVRRQLNIVIAPKKETYLPGEEGEVDIIVTDQLGKPVEAAVSLALVNEALYAHQADTTPGIVSFFQEGASRYTEFLVISTAGFSYTAQSQKLVKQIENTPGNWVFAPNRLEQGIAILGQELQFNSSNTALQMSCMSAHDSIFNNGRVAGQHAGGFVGGGTAGNMAPLFYAGSANDYTFVPPGQAQAETTGQFPVTAGLRFGLDAIQSNAIDGMINGVPSQHLTRNFFLTANSVSPQMTLFGTPQTDMLPQANPSVPPNHTTLWLSPITTDAAGKATASITFPDTASQWRFTARGATVETLVGEATASVVTRKDFFADIRLPEVLQEGDVMPFLATIYNLSDSEGEVSLSLKVDGGSSVFETDATVSVTKEATAETLFKPYTVPFCNAVKITLTAKLGDREDTLERHVLVRPWGLEFASHTGGVTGDAADAVLELPGGQNYNGRKLTVSLSPSIESAIIDLALGRAANLTPLDARRVSCLIWPEPQSPPSALLAAASALHYARDRKAPAAEIDALAKRTAELVAGHVATQAEKGLWTINSGKDSQNYVSTATAYWGLALADSAGIKVHPATLSLAADGLRRTMGNMDAGNSEGRAIITHALSITGSADFSVANRLYRERDRLSETALAYLAAAFVHMDRDGFARDLLGLLAKKAQTINAGGQSQKFWVGGSVNALVRDRAETTALVLWCYAKLDRASGVASSAADFLVTEAARLNSTRSLGAVVNALSEYYRSGERNADDFEVAIIVNDKTVHTAKSDQLRGTEHFVLMADTVNAGANRVRIQLKGRGQVRYSATLSGFSPDMKDPESFDTPHFMDRKFYHDKLSYRDAPLNALSLSEVKQLEQGQRFRAHIRVMNRRPVDEYFVWEEALPAGALLVDGSVKGNFARFEHRGGKLIVHWKPQHVGQLDYQLVAHAPGNYRILPSVLREATNRGRMRLGEAHELEILPSGQESTDVYTMSHSEHFELANKLFQDGRYDEAQKHLDHLYSNPDNKKRYEKELARMLLWIHTERAEPDADRLVEVFEILRERHPDLVIPFDKILLVGDAYRSIGEFERAWLVFRAAIRSSFLNDSRISAVLEDQGQYLGSVKFQERLWFEYPDSAEVVTSLFALSQSLFQKAPEAKAIAARERRIRDHSGEDFHTAPEELEEPEKVAMLEDSKRLLERFLALYPHDPLADDAAFSEVNVYFALKDYAGVVSHAEAGAKAHPKSSYVSSFHYMAALGHFWQRHYKQALDSAVAVAEGDSKDRDYARYITAQIHHATGKAVEAMAWYEKVKSLYPDAAEAIAYFEEKKIGVPEVTTVAPGKPVELDIDYRNIKDAELQVYEVDLLKLYLREKNLADIAKIDLAGIDPAAEISVPLGDGKDFADKEKTVKLDLKQEGAYLVICRGDDLFTSGLVLITPLALEIQEDPAGAVRVNVRDTAKAGSYVPEVLVKIVGTANDLVTSGHTDLRGIFQADGINGTATVLAKAGDRHYAFYRGDRTLGTPPEAAAKPALQQALEGVIVPAAAGKTGSFKQLQQSDYLLNIDADNAKVQESNWTRWDSLRRGKNDGVEAKDAY